MHEIGEKINVELFKGKTSYIEKMEVIGYLKGPSGRETHYKLLNKDKKEYIKTIKQW